MYLLDSHTSNVCKSLPITDIKSYKHVVYIFDAMYYIVSKWPTVHNGTSQTQCTTSAQLLLHSLILQLKRHCLTAFDV